MRYERLLSPLDVGPVRVPNRVVSTAHGAFLDFYRPGHPPDQYVAYQERRAAGGAGLLILQPVHVHPTSHSLGHYVYEEHDLRAKLRLLADRVHAHGTPVLVQLIHFGAEFDSDARADLEPLWAFSPLVAPTGIEVAHEMTPSEIGDVIDGFVRTAVIAVEAGLDGVELHGAHGYLVQQSYSPWGNQRADEWGDHRRFVVTVLERLREAIGPDKALGIRLSLDDALPASRGGLGPEGIRDVAREVVATGTLDYVNTSWGSRAAHYATAVGNYEHPQGELLPLVRELRAAIDARVPVIGAGRIATPDLAEHALREGTCDLVAMTRAQIADPDVVRKIAAGEAERIRPCVAANAGCVDRMYAGLGITCFHNPDVGREHRLGEPAAATPGRVLVVGGGPAGLKAAEIAARRGHDVVLAEAAGRLGGRLRLATAFGPQAELAATIGWLTAELDRLQVDVRLSTPVTADTLTALTPDTVVLATGALPRPDLLEPTDGSVPVVSTDDVLREPFSGYVLVLDQLGTHESVQAAECLAAAGAAVTIVTPFQTLGPKLGFTHVRSQLRRLHAAGCVIETSTLFTGIADGAVRTRHAHSAQRRHRPFDVVVAALPPVARVELRADAERIGLRVLVAGDAVAPRTALHAFREGDGAGRLA